MDALDTSANPYPDVNSKAFFRNLFPWATWRLSVLSTFSANSAPICLYSSFLTGGQTLSDAQKGTFLFHDWPRLSRDFTFGCPLRLHILSPSQLLDKTLQLRDLLARFSSESRLRAHTVNFLIELLSNLTNIDRVLSYPVMFIRFTDVLCDFVATVENLSLLSDTINDIDLLQKRQELRDWIAKLSAQPSCLAKCYLQTALLPAYLFLDPSATIALIHTLLDFVRVCEDAPAKHNDVFLIAVYFYTYLMSILVRLSRRPSWRNWLLQNRSVIHRILRDTIEPATSTVTLRENCVSSRAKFCKAAEFNQVLFPALKWLLQVAWSWPCNPCETVTIFCPPLTVYHKSESIGDLVNFQPACLLQWAYSQGWRSLDTDSPWVVTCRVSPILMHALITSISKQILAENAVFVAEWISRVPSAAYDPASLSISFIRRLSGCPIITSTSAAGQTSAGGSLERIFNALWPTITSIESICTFLQCAECLSDIIFSTATELSILRRFFGGIAHRLLAEVDQGQSIAGSAPPMCTTSLVLTKDESISSLPGISFLFPTCYDLPAKADVPRLIIMKLIDEVPAKISELFPSKEFQLFLSLFAHQPNSLNLYRSLYKSFENLPSGTVSCRTQLRLLFLMHNVSEGLDVEDFQGWMTGFVVEFLEKLFNDKRLLELLPMVLSSTTQFSSDGRLIYLAARLELLTLFRGWFYRLPGVTKRLVHVSCQLAVDSSNQGTRQDQDGRRKYVDFARSCLAFAFITVPDLTQPTEKTAFFSLVGQTAVLLGFTNTATVVFNEAIGQFIACFDQFSEPSLEHRILEVGRCLLASLFPMARAGPEKYSLRRGLRLETITESTYDGLHDFLTLINAFVDAVFYCQPGTSNSERVSLAVIRVRLTSQVLLLLSAYSQENDTTIYPINQSLDVTFLASVHVVANRLLDRLEESLSPNSLSPLCFVEISNLVVVILHVGDLSKRWTRNRVSRLISWVYTLCRGTDEKHRLPGSIQAKLCDIRQSERNPEICQWIKTLQTI